MTKHGIGDAVVAPLKDFGMMKAKVPVVLQRASTDPYKMPERTDCAYLEHEVAELDVVLGPDVDVPRSAGKPTMVGRGSRAASDAALDAVRDLTTGWIPFRGTVRRLTGAADNQDEIEDAAHAGGLRRAYLKGLGLQMGCAHPAAPLLLQTREVIASKKAPAAPALQTPEQAVVIRASDPGAASAPTQAAPVSSAVVVSASAPGV